MKKEITVHCIAQTRTNREEMQAWLENVGAVEFSEKLPSTYHESNVHFDEEYTQPEGTVTDADLLVGVSGKRCYNSFEVGMNPNVSKIREDWGVYLDNILKSGHGSVLEHTSWTWAFEGVTRVFTAEMNRHRAGVAISEASLRYIRFGDAIPYWEPLSIRACEGEITDENRLIESKKHRTRSYFKSVFEHVLSTYRMLEEIWADDLAGDFARKKQLTSMFRRIVPLGVSVGAVYTLNLRALRHIITMRCDPAAEEEIAYAMGLVAKEMCEQEPRLMGDFVQEGGFWKPKYRKV